MRTFKALIISDDHAVETVLRFYLLTMGCKVFTANGENTEDMYNSFAPFDIVIINLPGKNVNIAKAIKYVRPITMIMAIGSNLPEMGIIDAALSRPLKIADLEKAIEKYFGLT